ncbi:MAG: M24 family metallopeptidase [Nanoarchaeota archaeon]
MVTALMESHIKAAELLGTIKDEVKEYLIEKKNLNEYKVWKFVRRRFSYYNLRTDKECPIVAFGPNTSYVHYFPKKTRSEPLKTEIPILLDIWAHLPYGIYADMTWMFYYGRKPDPLFQKVFNAILASRDAALSYLRDQFQDGKVPISNKIDAVVRESLNDAKLGAYFFHSTGHSMTQRLVHGLKSNKGLSPKNDLKMKPRLPYTIEPGLYLAHLDHPFGARSEIDFYVDDKKKIVVTTPLQKELDYILPRGQSTLDGF